MTKNLLTAATLAVGLCAGVASPAIAQQVPPPSYIDSNCGSWQGDVWTANGNCPELYRHERVTGTITDVKGHLVSVQQTDRTLVIDDTAALNNQLTGKVAVGRRIVAHGYWNNNTFYATLITTTDAAADTH